MEKRLKFSDKVKKVLKILGPGLVTGASDDDPSGIATYSQAGARFGFSTLWTIWVTYPLMAAIQEMCARIGLTTRQGLTVTVRDHYPRSVLYLLLLFSIPAITLNIGADIHGMGAVAHMLVPRVPASVFSVVFTGLTMYAIIRFSYRKIAKILKWLCLSLLLYMIVPFISRPDWGAVAKASLIPTVKWDKEFLSILVAVLGTTISPYLFFWQATMEAEEEKRKRSGIMVDRHELEEMRKDVNIGMALSNVVMYFIMLAAGAVLHSAGITRIDTVEQAAQALEPLAGRWAYLFFALGVIGTGFLAIPVLAGSQAYMVAETFRWKKGLDKKFPQARLFYLTIILSLLVGFLLNFIGITPIQALFYTAMLYGITAPVSIAVILHIANNKKIMKENANTTLSNVLGIITLLLMTASAVALIWFYFK
jgi:NRAMP (natural resistance-associated macrophage protein)-like metal ion transporter